MEALVIDNGPRQALGAARSARGERPRDARRRCCARPTSSSRATGRAPSPNTASAPEEAARLRPGIVCVSLCAYGHDGPWAGRRGFNSLVQNANGLNVAEARGGSAPSQAASRCPPRRSITPPAILMAFAAMTALKRRATEGGSWHVRCSLAQTGALAPRSRPRRRRPALARTRASTDVRDRLDDSHSGFGRLTAVRHSAVMSETPTRWERPSVPLGTHRRRHGRAELREEP